MEVAMSRVKLDDRIIGHAERKLHSHILWDIEAWGFGCRIPPAGHPEFIAYFHTPQGLRRIAPVGSFGALTTEQARGIARDIIGRNDPAAHRHGFEHRALHRQIRAI